VAAGNAMHTIRRLSYRARALASARETLTLRGLLRFCRAWQRRAAMTIDQVPLRSSN
jgi:hypothetical protein